MKFLIVRLSSLGDIVHTLPVVNYLRLVNPNAQIDWLVGPKGYDLLKLIPEINNVYLLSYRNIKLIQKEKYDFVIDVQGLFKSGFLSKLAFGKKTIGFKNTREFAHIFYDEKVDVGHLFKTKNHIVDLNLKLVSTIGNRSNQEGVKFSIPKLNNLSNEDLMQIVDFKKKYILVFPGTTWTSKMWSIKHWYELISKLSKEHEVLVCASLSDMVYLKPLVDELDSNSIKYTNLIGKTNLKDLIYLIQKSNLVIGLDSAGIHLASAIKNDYGIPQVIGLYGPTSPYRTGPYNMIQNCMFLSDLNCIACRKKTCPLGHHKCMEEIMPSSIERLVGQMAISI